MWSNATEKINYDDRTFSTEEKAKEYILLNKPCLSYMDVLKTSYDYLDATDTIFVTKNKLIDKIKNKLV